MSLQFNKRKTRNIFILILLFLCSMNFQAKFHYFVFVLFAVLIISQKAKLFLNRKSVLYFSLSCLMAIYDADEGVLSMLRCLSPFMMYAVGFNFTVYSYRVTSGKNIKDSSLEGSVFALLIAICAGSFVHYLLNAITNLGALIGRNTIDVWSGEIMAATGQACLACLILGMSVAIVFKPLKTYQKYIGIVCIIVVLAYNLVLSARLIIAILFILFAICILYLNKIEKNANRKMTFVIKIAMVILAVGMAYSFNVGGIQDALMKSNFVERFSDTLNFWDNSERNQAKLQFVLNGWKYPFGGLNLRNEYGYAHDLLLDGYDEYGALGFVLLLGVVWNGLIAIYRLVRHSGYSHELKLMLLCIYASILCVFCIEPILAGMAWLFVLFCFLNGFMDGMYQVE